MGSKTLTNVSPKAAVIPKSYLPKIVGFFLKNFGGEEFYSVALLFGIQNSVVQNLA